MSAWTCVGSSRQAGRELILTMLEKKKKLEGQILNINNGYLGDGIISLLE